MDTNRFDGPRMSPAQIDAYLARIGLTGPVPLTLEGLSALQRAHQQSVPFENIAILAGRPLSLDHEALFDKIVTRRQGGVCAELNTLYNWLLWSLGFEVRSYSARVLTPFNIFFRRHRVLGVTLDGRLYTTDVGFTTEHARRPLLLEEGVVQHDGSCAYVYRREPFFGWVECQRKPGEDWTRVLGFTDEPQADGDFLPVLFYFEHSPASNMNQMTRVSLYTSDTQIRALRHHDYLVEEHGQPVERRPLTPEEELQIARAEFGLDTAGIPPERITPRA